MQQWIYIDKIQLNKKANPILNNIVQTITCTQL